MCQSSKKLNSQYASAKFEADKINKRLGVAEDDYSAVRAYVAEGGRLVSVGGAELTAAEAWAFRQGIKAAEKALGLKVAQVKGYNEALTAAWDAKQAADAAFAETVAMFPGFADPTAATSGFSQG